MSSQTLLRFCPRCGEGRGQLRPLTEFSTNPKGIPYNLCRTHSADVRSMVYLLYLRLTPYFYYSDLLGLDGFSERSIQMLELL